MKLKGGEFSTGTTGNFQPELTMRNVIRFMEGDTRSGYTSSGLSFFTSSIGCTRDPSEIALVGK